MINFISVISHPRERGNDNKLLILFFLFLTSFIFAFSTSVSAQATSERTQKYKLTFPIAELGNCTDVASCRDYCDDPVNRDSCKSFAKTKGIENPVETQKETILQQAQTELGCTSEISCKSLCNLPENFEKCSQFAKKFQLRGGLKVEKTAIADKVIQFMSEKGLTCTSFDSCKELCVQEQNKQTCTQLAENFGLRGGIERKGPGGCASNNSCREYCSDPEHFEECSQFSKKAGGPTPQLFRGPGGCTSEDSCKEYCSTHPGECKNFKDDTKPDINNDGVVDQNDIVKLQETCQELAQRVGSNETTKADYVKYCNKLPGLIQNHARFCRLPEAERPDYMQGEEQYKKYCIEATKELEQKLQERIKKQEEQTQEKQLERRMPTRRPSLPCTSARVENPGTGGRLLPPCDPTRRPTTARSPIFDDRNRFLPEPTKRPEFKLEPTHAEQEFENENEPKLEPTKITTVQTEPTKEPEEDSTNSGSGSSGSGTSGSNSGSDGDEEIHGVFTRYSRLNSFIDWLLVR